jgi:hypothetical protein
MARDHGVLGDHSPARHIVEQPACGRGVAAADHSRELFYAGWMHLKRDWVDERLLAWA